jgi:hypothetical protein
LHRQPDPQAADFIEQQAGLPKSSCQAAGPV